MGILFIILLLPATALAQKITIEATSHHRVNAPVRIRLAKPGLGSYGLYNRSTSKTYPVQWENNETAWFLLTDSLAAGKPLQLELKLSRTYENSVTLQGYEDGIMVKNGGKPVLFYHTNAAMPPADSPSYYKRSGFIHPVYSPSGKPLTDDFPVTHAHHHGLFHAWADTKFRHDHVDFWNQQKQEGTVSHLIVLNRKEGPVFSELKTVQEYLSSKHGVVLRETWDLRVFSTPVDHFLYDIFVEQENVTSDTLYLNKYIYGGMAFRGSKQWDSHSKAYQNPWHILTGNDKQDSSANHTAAKWVTAWGSINGTPASITIFDHRSNFRYPQKVRVHPTMPYFVFSPVVDEPFMIPPGGKYKAQYRYYISDIVPPEYLLQRLNEDWQGN